MIPDWIPIEEVDLTAWVDGGLYWLKRPNGKTDVIRVDCGTTPLRGPCGEGRPVVVSVSLHSTRGTVRAVEGCRVRGPIESGGPTTPSDAGARVVELEAAIGRLQDILREIIEENFLGYVDSYFRGKYSMAEWEARARDLLPPDDEGRCGHPEQVLSPVEHDEDDPCAAS